MKFDTILNKMRNEDNKIQDSYIYDDVSCFPYPWTPWMLVTTVSWELYIYSWITDSYLLIFWI